MNGCGIKLNGEKRMPNPLLHTIDWNILIILDAMRYDYFERFNTLFGTLTKVVTEESCTHDFLINNFPDNYYPYVYITANAYISNLQVPATPNGFIARNRFEEIIEVWKHEWNGNYGTVLPRSLTDIAEPYLIKEKVILHYGQPHFPSIGKTSVPIYAWQPISQLAKGFIATGISPASVSIETIKKAYEENVRIILKEVEYLVTLIDSTQKIVITSDHGEMLGEHGLRMHLCTYDDPILTHVPWFEVKNVDELECEKTGSCQICPVKEVCSYSWWDEDE